MLNDLYLPGVSGTGMRYFVLDMPPGGTCIRKGGMLIVLLKGVNFGFWSQLACT